MTGKVCIVTRKLITGIAILLILFAVTPNAFAQNMSSARISVSGLYQICSADVEAENFSQTRCSAYIEGHRASFMTFLFFVAPELESMSEDSFLKPMLGNDGCGIGTAMKTIANKKAAQDFLEFVDSKKDHIAGGESPGSYFLFYFLGCGTLDVLGRVK